MKKLILTTFLFFTTLSTASALDVPVGQFEYIRSLVSFVKDVKVINVRYTRGQEQYEELKAKKYTCRRYPNYMMKCHKYLSERDIVEIPLPEVLSLTPLFDEKYEGELVSESDYITIYDIKQEVSTPHFKAKAYRLYKRPDGRHHIDIKLGDYTFRYNYEQADKLNLQLIKRKGTSRSGWLEYGILSDYQKL